MSRWIIIGVLFMLLAGCGQSDDRSQARGVTVRFLKAMSTRETVAACAALSADTRSELESQAGKPCVRAIASMRVAGGRILRVEVFVTNAKVDLSSGQSLFLGKTTLGWKLSALGCRPAGPATSRPYDCELQA